MSDFHSWNQLSHAEDYLLYSKNIGPNLCIDETSFSCGELYTLLLNRDAHGKKGSIIAIVKGTKADTVTEIIKKIPIKERYKVREVTLDMSPSMQKIIRSCFPKATQVVDRFHVQKQVFDALQDLRVAYRWQVIREEEKNIKEAKRKGIEYKSKELENGDTLRQLLVRSRFLLFKAPNKWGESQKQRAEILFNYFPDIKHMYYHCIRVGSIFSQTKDKNVARLKFAKWYEEVENQGYPNFSAIISMFENHSERILNYFENRSTNAAAESFNAKLKAFRASFRGVNDMKFFLYRVAKIYA